MDQYSTHEYVADEIDLAKHIDLLRHQMVNTFNTADDCKINRGLKFIRRCAAEEFWKLTGVMFWVVLVHDIYISID